MNSKIKCKICGKEIECWKSSGRKYCSRKCYLYDKPNTLPNKKILWTCKGCRKKEQRNPSKCNHKYCSYECAYKHRIRHFGKDNPTWKGGYIGQNGYKYIRNNGKYQLEHIVIYEAFHKIKIPVGLVIHHIDGDKLNNKVSNLNMVSEKEHRIIHSRLTTEDDSNMKYLYSTGRYSHRDLAKIFGVDKSQISLHIRGLRVGKAVHSVQTVPIEEVE